MPLFDQKNMKNIKGLAKLCTQCSEFLRFNQVQIELKIFRSKIIMRTEYFKFSVAVSSFLKQKYHQN